LRAGEEVSSAKPQKRVVQAQGPVEARTGGPAAEAGPGAAAVVGPGGKRALTEAEQTLRKGGTGLDAAAASFDRGGARGCRQRGLDRGV